MGIAEIEDLRVKGTRIIFAADQEAFHDKKGHTFCVLTPLLTVEGERLAEEDFPQRGRVWWMLRKDIDPSVVVTGMIWSGTLEMARDDHSDRQDKDRYQVEHHSIHPGAPGFLEVMDDPSGDPAPDRMLSSGIPWPRPVLPQVLVRTPTLVFGPLRTKQDLSSGMVRLEAPNAGSPWIYRAPRKALDGAGVIHEFHFTSRKWSHLPQEEIRGALISERYLSILEQQGEKIDGSTDQQILNWGFRHLKATRKEQECVRDLRDRMEAALPSHAEPEFASRVKRFRRLLSGASDLAALGAEFASLVAGNDAFRELIERHKDGLVRVQVEEEVARRRGTIESQIRGEEERLQRVRTEIAGLEEKFESRSREKEAEFRRENEDRLRSLEAREQKVEARDRALADLERAVRERLERVLESYRTESERIGDAFVAQLPILRRMGLVSGSASLAIEAASCGAAPPTPVSNQKPRAKGGLSEEQFIEQFQRVTEKRGFTFDREDLIHFHAAAKIGVWTVLAGASGLGKSSLSRLYAEALGVPDAHLLVPVRPDWLDDRDILGAFNPISQRFEPASSGLVDHLYRAQEDHRRELGGIYLVCLDEMNLARVEQYLAVFLSVAEQPPDQRRITLFPAGLARADDPFASHREITLGPNLRFVGTVNVDETTHFFSPKVLDRATIVPLSRPDLRPGARPPAVSEGLSGLVPVHFEEYLSWAHGPREAPASVVDRILEIDQALALSNQGIGFRLRDRMLALTASSRSLVGEERALDLAILGSVLPRLRVTAPRSGETLARLKDLLPIGRFRRSAAVLEVMADLEDDGGFFQLL